MHFGVPPLAVRCPSCCPSLCRGRCAVAPSVTAQRGERQRPPAPAVRAGRRPLRPRHATGRVAVRPLHGPRHRHRIRHEHGNTVTRVRPNDVLPRWCAVTPVCTCVCAAVFASLRLAPAPAPPGRVVVVHDNPGVPRQLQRRRVQRSERVVLVQPGAVRVSDVGHDLSGKIAFSTSSESHRCVCTRSTSTRP